MRGYDSIFEQRYSREQATSRGGRFLMASTSSRLAPLAPVRRVLQMLLHAIRRPANLGTGVRW